jgi:hypothetical protein
LSIQEQSAATSREGTAASSQGVSIGDTRVQWSTGAGGRNVPLKLHRPTGRVPGNGKPFPDGAKMAKIHWVPKKNETEPGQPTVPGTLHDVDFMVKDSKRFADSGGWGWAVFD